jgi:hypothetical protein
MKPGAVMIALGLAASCAGLDVIDRIVATVGSQIITESEVRAATRIAALLNEQPLDLGAEARRQTTGRLIEQALLRQEMTASRFTMPGPVEAEQALGKLKQESNLSEEGFRLLLVKYGVREEQLQNHLWWQIAILRFCEFRFGADLQVSATDVEEYYRTKFRDDQAPKLDDVRESIEKILTAERANQSLDRWLRDSRAKTRIEVREESFQ